MLHASPGQESVSYLQAHFHEFVEDLKCLTRIPSISFHGFPEGEVQRSAEQTAILMKKHGLQNVQLLQLPEVHPYVYGEFLGVPEAPTLLLYAHHDVQPPGNPEAWETDPFEPTLKAGPGGDRLYGRGAADDKAGILVHLSAIASFLQTTGTLPLNIKMLVEGEEETGSTHLSEFLEQYQELLKADALILTDTLNFDSGIPALTVALRGLVTLEVEVRSMEKSLHSGLYGGPVPDPTMALMKGLSAMVDSEGKLSIPNMLDKVMPVSADEEAEFQKIPYDENVFRNQLRLIPSAQILTRGLESPVTPWIQTWRMPSLTMNAFQASSREQAGNIINNTAWAKITIRLVPRMEPEQVLKQLKDFLKSQIPWGMEILFKSEPGHSGWSINPEGPAFEAARRALTRGYGQSALCIGCGGSIPFVKPFSESFKIPVLLIGVEDPYTNAHGENESLLLSDFEKACVSQLYLFEELARCLKSELSSQN